MKILINTSNLKKGGAMQVAHSFLNNIKYNQKSDFYVILSYELSKQINKEAFPSNFNFYFYNIKPGLINSITGWDSFLQKLESKIKPNCVFSIFGPSYWKPKVPHLIGFAKGQYIYRDSPFFDKLSSYQKIKLYIQKTLHKINLNDPKAFFWVETNDVRLRLSKFLDIDKNRITTISNTYNFVFDRYIKDSIKKKNDEYKMDKSCFNFITITSYYPHKNLSILKKIIPILRKDNIKCKFYLTIENADFVQFEKFEDYIVNLGPVTVNKCPILYDNADALFLPTLLECFTASYPEAMKMKKPILTSDLSFSRNICKDSAIYFNPLDPEDIVDCINQIMLNLTLRKNLIENGNKRLKDFVDSKEKAKILLDICKKISR